MQLSHGLLLLTEDIRPHQHVHLFPKHEAVYGNTYLSSLFRHNQMSTVNTLATPVECAGSGSAGAAYPPMAGDDPAA